MGYLRSTSNYSKRITQSDPTHIMNMNYLMAISVKTLMIDGGYYLEKEFVELIRMNTLMVLYQTVN